MTNKKWTLEDLDYLRRHWQAKSIAYIAASLWRTANATRLKARKLKLQATTPTAPVRSKILATLKTSGPLPIANIAELLGMRHEAVYKSILDARKNYPGQFFRIVKYLWPDEDRKGAQAPVYSASGGRDVPRPRPTIARRNAKKRAYYFRNKALISAKRASANNASKAGTVNPWMQLAHADVRPVMARMRSLATEAA